MTSTNEDASAGAPMSLGEFRATTAHLPDETPIMHVYDGMTSATATAIVTESLDWEDGNFGFHRTGVVVLTGGPHDDTRYWATASESTDADD